MAGKDMEEDFVIRVALLGCGTVGSAVVRRSLDGADPSGRLAPLTLTHVLDRRAELKRRAFPGAPITWTTSFDDILSSDVDVVVEAIGGVDPATDWMRQALLAGKSVVTANKQVVARDGAALWSLAERQGRQFRFEAAVGGVMPIVRAVADGLAGDRLTRIVAILNGTTNAILSQMDETGCDLPDALADAQARGYAERDPSADLDGIDAQSKLAILCSLAFGVRLDSQTIPTRSTAAISREDIARARRQGGTIRQIAHAEFDWASSTLTAWVAPIVVSRASIFGRATDAQNVALITGEHSGELGIFGAGAGGAPTAVAVIGDLLAIARDRAAIVPAPPLHADFTLQTFSTPLFAEAV